jgi:hypothetical protein
MERNVTQEEKDEATLRQGKHLMHAGISASLSDNLDEAVSFFDGAMQRFEAIHSRTNAGIARAWLEGLKERQQQRLAKPQP